MEAAWVAETELRVPAGLIASQIEQLTQKELSELRLAAAFTNSRPASSKLPISYTAVPPIARQLLASVIGRVQRGRQQSWARFPSWPIDLTVDALADIAGLETIKFRDQVPVLASHDIDSPEGLRNLVELFLPIEEAVGCGSANYIVPCAWPVDEGLVRETIRRGHEIGVHGYDHANLTAFADRSERIRRLSEGRKFADRYDCVGYRAPSLLRTDALMDDLQHYYQYDSSIPTSGGPFPVPNNGCASARPWRMGSMWELPLTLPRDGSLRFLGHSASEILAMWKRTAEAVARSGGIISILTHCEVGFSGNGPMLDAYRVFLEWCSCNDRFRFVRPRDLANELERSRTAHVQ